MQQSSRYTIPFFIYVDADVSQGGDPLNRQFNQIEIEAIEVRASIQRQSTEDVFNVNSIHVKAELTLKYVDG